MTKEAQIDTNQELIEALADQMQTVVSEKH